MTGSANCASPPPRGVTTFSSGDLNPLFTTNVTNSTSTPGLSFNGVTANANVVLAGPVTGGTDVYSFRALVGADLPAPTALTLGGTQSMAPSSHNWISSIDTSGVPHQSQPAFSDILGSVSAAQMPAPTASTLGGIESITPVPHQWVSYIDATGAPHQSQPVFADISGSLVPAQLPAPTASTLGGIQAITQTPNNWVQYIDTNGAPHLAQPAFNNLTGSMTLGQTPLSSMGDLLFTNSAPALARLPIGGANQFLGISGGLPAWLQPLFSTLSGAATTSQLPGGGVTTVNGTACTLGSSCTLTSVNGVTFGTSPATNTVPVVTSSNTTTYQTVPIAAGGTGQTTASGAFNTLSPLTTEGDLHYYHTASNARLAIGGANMFLTSNGSDPAWAALTGAGFGSQTAHFVMAAPSGSSGNPTFRSLVGADLPSPTTSALGGVQSVTCAGGQFLSQISTGGVPQCATPSGGGGLGNGTTVIDASLQPGTDFSTKVNACFAALPAAGGTCDARGFSGSQTMSVSISSTNRHAELILPAATIQRAIGAQFLLGGGEHIHGSLLRAYSTIIQSNVSDTSAVFYSSILLGGIELDHFQIRTYVPGYYALDFPITESYLHDFIQTGGGWGMNLQDGGGCNCYNAFTNLKFINIRTGGNTNWNDWTQIEAGDPSLTTYAFNFDDGYLNLINGLSIENSPQSVRFGGSTHDNEIKNFNLENDGVLGSGSTAWLPVLAAGATRNKIDSKIDVVDNSGNLTNVYGTLSSLPVQTNFNGRFSVSAIPDFPYGPTVSAHTSYYAAPSSSAIPTGTWFSGADYTIEAWVAPTLTYPGIGFQIIADFGNLNPSTDRMVVGLSTLTPFVQVYQGGAYQLIYGGNSLPVGAWSHLVVSYSASAGKATIYVNNISTAGAQAIWAPLSVTRAANTLAVSSGGAQPLIAALSHVAIYNNAMSAGTVNAHYTTGSSGSGYEAMINAASPLAYWPLNDSPTSLTLTSAGATSGSSTVYTGTITGGGSNAFVNKTFTVSGFSNPANNGVFTCIASTATSLTLNNSAGTVETDAGVASYPGITVDAMGVNNGTYQGPAILGSLSGISGDTVGSGKAAQFGGTTLYTYYQVCTDWNGGQTNVSPPSYVVNAVTLSNSNYNVVVPYGAFPGCRRYTILKGDTAHSIAAGFVQAQFPINDTGPTNWPTSAYNPPARNSTGDVQIAGSLNLPSQSANQFFASPSGGPGVPNWRAVVGADLPAPTSSTLGGVRSIAASSHTWMSSIDTSGVPHQSQPAFPDISGSVAPAQLPAPTASTLGGVQSIAASSHTWISSIDSSGVPHQSQPAFVDISGSVAPMQLPTPTASTLGGVQSIAAFSHTWISSIDSSGMPHLSQPAFTDISGSVAPTQLPTPTSSALGGVQSIAASSHNWISFIDTSGVPHQSQPAFPDISGSVAPTQLPAPTVSTLGGLKSIGQTANNWVQYVDTTGTPQLAQPAFGNLSGSLALMQTPLTTVGDLLIANSAPALARLPIGGANQVLGISGGLPTWMQPAFSTLSGAATTSQLPGSGVTTINGVNCTIGSNCTTPAAISTNSRTLSYTLQSSDQGKLVMLNGSNLTAKLPSAPSSGWWAEIQNLNASPLAVSPNGLNINGGTSNVTLQQYQILTVWTDGSNYFSRAPQVAGTGITLTPASNGIAIGLTNTSTTVNGQSCALGSTCSLTSLNGVSFGNSPATNTVPVVTSSNTTTYETLPLAAGGTGQTTALAAFNTLSPLNAEGDLIYYHSSANARLGIGSNGKCLTSNGTDPVWGPCAATPTLAFSLDIPTPITTDSNLYQHAFGQAVTLTRISCATDTGTVGINFDVRAEGTPNTAGINVLSGNLSCTTSTGVTTTFSNSAVAANVPFNLQVNSVSGTPGIVRIHVAYQ